MCIELQHGTTKKELTRCLEDIIKTVELERTQTGQKLTQLEERTHPLPGRHHQDGGAGTHSDRTEVDTTRRKNSPAAWKISSI